MLTAIILELTAVKTATLPVSHGAMAYAAALDLFLRYDVQLARSLHDCEGIKPLKVSMLIQGFPVVNQQLHIKEGAKCMWRLSAIAESSARCLLKMTAGGGVRIGDSVFEITKMFFENKQQMQAGNTTYQELVSRYAGIDHLIAPLTLEFLTPTTFRSGQFEQPFPIPALVFQSLANQWSKWSQRALPMEMQELKDNIILSNWQGETKRVELGGRRTVGFTGRYSYRFLKATPPLVQTACILADYAFYAGVGWQTAHGLGQVRRIASL